MDFSSVSWLGVAVATVVAFVIGGAYYGLLGKPWMKAARIDPAETNMSASLFITSILSEFVMAIILSVLFGVLTMGEPSIMAGLKAGFLLWLGFVMTTQVINHRYQGFGWDLTLIDGVHWLLVLLAQGAIIGYFSAPAAMMAV